MNKIVTTVAAALAASTLVAGPASAAENGAGMRLFAKLVFDMGDTNRDGSLDIDEIAALRMRGFDRADTNGDGLLSKAEQDAAAAKRKRRGEMASLAGEGHLERLDADGDGSVSRTEFRDAPRPFLELIDANADGAIDRDEMNRLAGIIARAR
jgi:hypothetical protein